MTDNRIQVRLDDDLAGWLRQRADMSRTGRSMDMQAREDLGLLREVIETELRRIRLTLQQARCLADVLNGTIIDSAVGTSLGLAYAECYDAFRLAREGSPAPDLSSYGAKHAPDGTDPEKWEQDLLVLLGRLGPAADYALRFAIARWWAEVHPQDSLQWRHPGEEDAGGFRADSPEGFGHAGLRITGN